MIMEKINVTSWARVTLARLFEVREAQLSSGSPSFLVLLQQSNLGDFYQRQSECYQVTFLSCGGERRVQEE